MPVSEDNLQDLVLVFSYMLIQRIELRLPGLVANTIKCLAITLAQQHSTGIFLCRMWKQTDKQCLSSLLHLGTLHLIIKCISNKEHLFSFYCA